MEIKFTVSEKKNDLVIKYGLFFKNIKVFHNDQEIDSFESKAEAKKGKIIKLTNGQLVTIKLKKFGFQVIKNSEVILPYLWTKEYTTQQRESLVKVCLAITSFQILIGLLIALEITKVAPGNINSYELLLNPLAMGLIAIWSLKKQVSTIPEILCLVLFFLYRIDMKGFSFINAPEWVSASYFTLLPLWPFVIIGQIRHLKRQVSKLLKK